MGGTQSHPFALVPASGRFPSEPIIGAEAMHRLMKSWVARAAERTVVPADADGEM